MLHFPRNMDAMKKLGLQSCERPFLFKYCKSQKKDLKIVTYFEIPEEKESISP